MSTLRDKLYDYSEEEDLIPFLKQLNQMSKTRDFCEITMLMDENYRQFLTEDTGNIHENFSLLCDYWIEKNQELFETSFPKYREIYTNDIDSKISAPVMAILLSDPDIIKKDVFLVIDMIIEDLDL